MEQEEIFLRFARKRERRAIALGILLLTIFLGLPLLGAKLSQVAAAAIAGAGLVGLLIYLWIDWRCPKCDRHLGREFKHTHCSHCGTRLMP
ncbi:MAG: hypothetical protein ACOY94_17520 [Bacillota bacterium]